MDLGLHRIAHNLRLGCDASAACNLVEGVLRLLESSPVHLLKQLVFRQELLLKEDYFGRVLSILVSQSIGLLLSLHVILVELFLGKGGEGGNFIFLALLSTLVDGARLAVSGRFLHLGDDVWTFAVAVTGIRSEAEA